MQFRVAGQLLLCGLKIGLESRLPCAHFTLFNSRTDPVVADPYSVLIAGVAMLARPVHFTHFPPPTHHWHRLGPLVKLSRDSVAHLLWHLLHTGGVS